jgi:hypothetical protein
VVHDEKEETLARTEDPPHAPGAEEPVTDAVLARTPMMKPRNLDLASLI